MIPKMNGWGGKNKVIFRDEEKCFERGRRITTKSGKGARK